ncbi:MAG: U32 family peptidase [Chromatiales bacterium]|nr:U32 family peptidase [Chromatiales bacterium]
MTKPPRPLELLAPAKNADFGIEAIRHGADAVYIGGPSFGARAAAGNDMADIERLAAFAHRYSARVFVALNTILNDDELEPARRLAWQVWEAGADALIVQDMGLLETDLPPIQLHASTQTDNRSLEKVRFLEQVGFSQVVLARELTLQQVSEISTGTSATLEFFVHGALCVAYSGQCYVSHAQTGRSANRGECSQMCRLPFSLADADGRMVAENRHLLSMKDNDQSANLRALAEAGVGSFKIEGRLKDLAYVKNVTAHYRQLLDAIIEADPRYARASAGRCTYGFEPRPEKTFNRSATDYFVNGRQADIAAMDTPKFAGEPIGRVSKVGRDWFEVETDATLNNGDGLAWFDARGELTGLRVNRVDGRRVHPAECDGLPAVGTALHRNRDQAFMRLLERDSAERRIGLHLRLSESEDGFVLTLTDEEGVMASAAITQEKASAQNPQRAETTLRENLSKLGNTEFRADAVELDLSAAWFVPVSVINALRRDAVERLQTARTAAYRRPPRALPAEPPAVYPQDELSYLGNVSNHLARAFYERHGVRLIADAYECNRERGEVSLMITRHCLRYSFNLCPKQVKGIRPDPMLLVNGSERLKLHFDCKRCEMHVIGRLRIARAS